MKLKLNKIKICTFALCAFGSTAFAGPDLIIEDISFLTLPARGQCTNVSVTVTNIGDEPSGTGIFEIQTISTESNTFGEVRTFGGSGFTTIEPGETETGTALGLHFPSMGEHIIYATVDVNDDVAESNIIGRINNAENNNGYSRPGVRVRRQCAINNGGTDPDPPEPRKPRFQFHIDPKVKMPSLHSGIRKPITPEKPKN